MVLKDAHGRRVGEIKDHGSKQVAYDASGRKVGEYNEDDDLTRNASGRVVGEGNLLTALL